MSKSDATPIEKLFGSKTRAKLLKLFFENPTKSYYVREMTRVIEEQINSVRRELLNLESIGIIKNETFDNKVYYAANMKHPYARPLTEIFATKISSGKPQDVHRSGWDEYVRPVRKYLTALVVTNRVPGEEGVDLMIVGDDRTKRLSHWAEVIEKKKGKPLNYVIFSKEDFIYRLSVRDKFVQEVLEMEITDVLDPEKLMEIKN